MAERPSIDGIELEGDYYHVRFRDPDAFEEIRTPAWAAEAAGDVSRNSKVRMGRRPGSDDWANQSVLIKKQTGASKARQQARRILEKLEA